MFWVAEGLEEGVEVGVADALWVWEAVGAWVVHRHLQSDLIFGPIFVYEFQSKYLLRNIGIILFDHVIKVMELDVCKAVL